MNQSPPRKNADLKNSLKSPWAKVVIAGNLALALAASVILCETINSLVSWYLSRWLGMKPPGWLRWLCDGLCFLSIAILTVENFFTSLLDCGVRMVESARQAFREIVVREQNHQLILEEDNNQKCLPAISTETESADNTSIFKEPRE